MLTYLHSENGLFGPSGVYRRIPQSKLTRNNTDPSLNHPLCPAPKLPGRQTRQIKVWILHSYPDHLLAKS
jgi:hypothetical protein